MAPVETALVNYSYNKTCFLYVPQNWMKCDLPFQDVSTFKVDYGEKKQAYFSIKLGGTSFTRSSEVILQLNSKYALLLGMKDHEQVIIQQVEKMVVQVEKLFLEPLNSDDWELMHLNASAVETNLLNQIRIVWKNQVFPVWIDQVFFFVRVVGLVPNDEPGMLVEFSEIHITPKERKGDVGVTTKKMNHLHDPYKHLRRHQKENTKHELSNKSSLDEAELSSSFSFLHRNSPGFLLHYFFTKSAFSNESPISDASKDHFQSLGFDFSLRVISFSKGKDNCNLPLSLQTTTAFISERTFSTHCWSENGMSCFVAYISKILSPLQKREHPDSKVQDKLIKSKDKSNLEFDSKMLLYQRVCINIMVLKPTDVEFDVPRALFRSTDFICVPLELKRRLSLEIASQVRVTSVEKPPFLFDTVFLHPLDNLHVGFNENVASLAFAKWVSETTTSGTSIVVCEGTLAKLSTKEGKVCDFVISLSQVDPPEQNSSFSSLQENSFSSDTEKSLLPSMSYPNYGFLSVEKMNSIEVKLGSRSPHMKRLIWPPGENFQKAENLYQRVSALSLDHLGGIKEICEEVLTYLELWFNLKPAMPSFWCPRILSNFGSMLITGSKGVGKSTFVKALCQKLVNYPHFIYVMSVKCIPLRGKRVETIAKKWDLSVAECVHRKPSILIFENLDQLASSSTSLEHETSQDGLYYNSIVQVFISLLEKIIVNKHSIVVLATAESVSSLHPALTSTKGKRIFRHITEMKPPDAFKRYEILQSLVKHARQLSAHHIEESSWKELAEKTQGYIAQDLCILVDRATHAAWMRKTNILFEEECSDEVQLLKEDFEASLKYYRPASFQEAQLHENQKKTWHDVGGLQEVKQVIEHLLTWPAKYKSLFANFGLKPQSNILLYGPPGTGKTLLASVVANECGMNFISIKGPELLSKYIGASELAVRDLFVRASSAKPCILFFDEFDALAPRRGHDSTGVTDRVVNQLLTQIDGVESIEGVYILAATSQPEMIDPALLRPGRMDKCLHCPLPNQEARLEILHSLSAKMALSADVNLKMVAAKTEHFSGADLQALLYTAQIKAFYAKQTKTGTNPSCSDVGDLSIIEKMVYMPSLSTGFVNPNEKQHVINFMNEIDVILRLNGESSFSRGPKYPSICLVVEQTHLLDALSETKPSVSAEERHRYQLIFERFKQSGGADFTAPTRSQQKVTLA